MILQGGLITYTLCGGGGKSASLDELTATENTDYYPPEGVDGFNVVHVRVPSNPNIIPLTAEAGNTYHASDYGVDGFDPVNAVGEWFDTKEEAEEQKASPVNERVFFDIEFTNIPDAISQSGYKTQMWAGTKNQETGEWTTKYTSSGDHWGMLYGQGILNPKLISWQVTTDGYYSCTYEYTNVITGNRITTTQKTGIKEGAWGNVKWELKGATVR